jgi:spore maturation protein CgeB
MKILIVGSDKHWAIENLYTRYLKSIEGVFVQLFPARSMFYDFIEKSFFNKIVHRLGVSSFYHNINNELLNFIQSYQPDIVWVFKGMEVLPDTLKTIHSMGIKTVNYNPDNPFIFSGRGSGNTNVTNSFKLYDLHLTYNLEVLNQIHKEYNIPCELLPFGYDLPEEFSFSDEVEDILSLCFLGNPDKERASFISSLLDREVPVAVYGNHWQNFLSHKNVVIHPPVYELEMWTTLRKYRVQLNMLRKHNLQSHNMRTFEITGVGGIQMAPDTLEHRLFFEDGEEIFLYRDVDEAALKAKQLLALQHKRTLDHRKAALNKSISAGYSYRNRAHQVYQFFSRLLTE